MALFSDRFKSASRRLMDDVLWVHGGVETPTRGCYSPGFGSDLEGRAEPPRPTVTGYGADFPGVAIGHRLVVAGRLFDVADIDLDGPTDDLTLHLRPAP